MSAAVIALALVTTITANSLLPPPPAAPLSAWTNAPGRHTVALSGDGVTLRGWTYPSAKPGAPVVLVFGGNAYCINTADAQLRRLQAQGATVVQYDYRGYGFSTGTADVTQFRNDALRLYDATVTRNGGKPAVVLGFSLGSLSASYVAAHRKVAGLVLASPFGSAPEEIAHLEGTETYVISGDALADLDVEANVATYAGPLLVVHGSADTTVPILQGREDFEDSPSLDKRFVAVAGAGHPHMLDRPAFLAAFKEFLASLAGAAG